MTSPHTLAQVREELARRAEERTFAAAVAAFTDEPPMLDAALAFRDSLIPQRDGDHFRQPLWHEWAIVEAFLAGAKFARAERPALDIARFCERQHDGC